MPATRRPRRARRTVPTAVPTAVLTAVVTLAAALVLAPGASWGASGGGRQDADSWRVPASASITVRGHGYGHGHGMSQYGAEGAARKGKTWRQIVDFYYRGLDHGTRGGKVSVLITGDTTDDLVVVARRGLRVTDTAAERTWTLPDRNARRWRVREADGQTVVAWKSRRWYRWRTLAGDGVFSAGGNPVRLVTPSGVRPYRGRLRAATLTPGSPARATVNRVSLENYVRGVVPLEMPATWSPAAVRAQAVAARTYAAYERAHPLSSAYQICDTTSCQVYGGVAAEHPASDAAVRATRHQVLLARGAPAFTQFSSSSGGWTSAGSAPYLKAFKDPYDGWSGNPVHSWSLPLTRAAIEAAWPSVGRLKRLAVASRDGHGQWGGRVGSVRIAGTGGGVTVSGDTFRYALGLRSTWFTLRVG